jgi:hypothetical protein
MSPEGAPLGSRRYHFFDPISRSIALSRIASAAYSRPPAPEDASDTSRPPYLDFQLYNVASDTPCLRARSADLAPASASFSTPVICSSLNRDRFIVRLSLKGRTLIINGGNLKGHVRPSNGVDARGHRPQSALPSIRKRRMRSVGSNTPLKSGFLFYYGGYADGQTSWWYVV